MLLKVNIEFERQVTHADLVEIGERMGVGVWIVLFRRVGTTRGCCPDRFDQANANDQNSNESDRKAHRAVHHLALFSSGYPITELIVSGSSTIFQICVKAIMRAAWKRRLLWLSPTSPGHQPD